MSWSLLFSFSNNDLKLFGLKPTDFVHALLPHHKYMELNLYFWKPVLTDILNKSKKLQGYKAFLSMWMQLGKCDLSRTPFCKEGPFLCKGDNFQDYKSKKNCNYNFCNRLSVANLPLFYHVAQCENYRIFLLLRFYVKSISSFCEFLKLISRKI